MDQNPIKILALDWPKKDVWVNEDLGEKQSIDRTTHLGIGAHPDDLEIMAFPGIERCYGSDEKWFSGVTLTDGSGGPRGSTYKDLDVDEWIRLRKNEQIQAAEIGNYAFQLQFGLQSSDVKCDVHREKVVQKLMSVLSCLRLEKLYTHQPFDFHLTHKAVFEVVIEALRRLPKKIRPRQLLGCEVWGSLDFVEGEKRVLNSVENIDLVRSLVEVYQSQIEGGKPYFEGLLGRWTSHAVFDDPYDIGESRYVSCMIDLTQWMNDRDMSSEKWLSQWL